MSLCLVLSCTAAHHRALRGEQLLMSVAAKESADSRNLYHTACMGTVFGMVSNTEG